jgi:ABC-type lipoprotein export system ATPase subunit
VSTTLRRVVIENYRSCLRTSIDLHPHLSVLIGPNGSGKTNVLQAIMLLNKMAREDKYPLSSRRAARSTVSSRIKVAFDSRGTHSQLNASVDSYTDHHNNDLVVASRQRWRFTRRGKEAQLEAPLSLLPNLRHFFPRQGPVHLRYLDRARKLRLVEAPPDFPKWAWSAFYTIARQCEGIRYYSASQFTNPSSSPASFQIEEEEGKRRRLTHFHGHQKVLYGMYSASKEGPESRYEQFIEIVGPKGLRLIDNLTFREVKTSSIDYSVRVGGKVERRKRNRLLVIPQFRIGKQKLSPNQLSEGTFKTLALLFHVLTEEGTILLIEEPEVCVHHGLLSSILELIKSSSQRKQMILSTHSDYVLDHVRPENVYQVAFGKLTGTVARNIPRAMTSKEYAALRQYLLQEGNLGEYWREGGLGDRP